MGLSLQVCVKVEGGHNTVRYLSNFIWPVKVLAPGSDIFTFYETE